MNKLVIAGTLIALGFVGPPRAESARPALELIGERMTLEYNAVDGEVAFVVAAESEVGLERIEVQAPSGAPILRIRSSEGGNLGLHVFSADSNESDLATFLASHPEGTYSIVARTVDGAPAFGSATLSHTLLPAPIVAYPLTGASDVPTQDVTVTWQPQAGAGGHRVSLEQGETDLMVVELGAGAGSFRIPDGILAGNTRYWIEIAAIAPNGNATFVKIPFMTR